MNTIQIFISRIINCKEILKKLFRLGDRKKWKHGEHAIILSSCRLGDLSPRSYIHKVHHTHNTKEAIQYIQFLNGDIDIDQKMYRFVFRSCFLDNDFIIDRNRLKREFLLSDIVFIEICSKKKYFKNGYFIHHLAADKGDAPTNNLIENEKSNIEYELKIQNKEEIEFDILNIVKLLKGKKVFFVTHIDFGIKVRKKMINELSEIFEKHNLPYINPTDQIDVFKNEMKDSNHYSSKGLRLLADYAIKKVYDVLAH